MDAARVRMWCVRGAIVAAPLAYGTVHPLPVAVFETAGFALFAWYGIENLRRVGNWPLLRDPLVKLAGAAIALGLVQLIPLPATMLRILSPGTYELAHEGLARAGLAPWSWHSIAVAPWLTEQAILWLAALTAWYVVLREEAASRQGAAALLRTLAIAGIALGALGLAQQLTGANAIFWIGLKRESFYATLVNPNNAAGMLTLATAACLGLAMATKNADRTLWFVAALFVGTTAVFSLSRGGIGVLAFALLLTASAAQRGNGAADDAWARYAPVGLLAGMAIFIAWIGSTEVLGELETVGEDSGSLNGRVDIWAIGISGLLFDYPFFGPGFGNFAEVFPIYQNTAVHYHVGAVENEYLHAFFEGGLAGGILGLAALWVAARRVTSCLRRGRIGLSAPVAAGLAALLVHMLIDFPLHLGGPALWILAVTAIVTAAVERPSEPGRVKKRRVREPAGGPDGGTVGPTV